MSAPFLHEEDVEGSSVLVVLLAVLRLPLVFKAAFPAVQLVVYRLSDEHGHTIWTNQRFYTLAYLIS
jgi:hypothetical protein